MGKKQGTKWAKTWLDRYLVLTDTAVSSYFEKLGSRARIGRKLGINARRVLVVRPSKGA